MRCPACGNDDDRVIDSRSSRDGRAVRRRRACSCGHRFTTFERLANEFVVRKRSGELVPFERGRVAEGILRAADDRLDVNEVAAMAVRVEEALRNSNDQSVTSEQVGLEVLTQLRAVDEVAYMRFASVYKGFQGPEDFEQELLVLRKEAPPKS
ncbi:MAG: transcriptional regulator NrdR, partial [Nitriliruptorales bacterium]|nr:transcriptional regulator NrdR [Nitriliruptorales bacterium]